MPKHITSFSCHITTLARPSSDAESHLTVSMPFHIDSFTCLHNVNLMFRQDITSCEPSAVRAPIAAGAVCYVLQAFSRKGRIPVGSVSFFFIESTVLRVQCSCLVMRITPSFYPCLYKSCQVCTPLHLTLGRAPEEPPALSWQDLIRTALI